MTCPPHHMDYVEDRCTGCGKSGQQIIEANAQRELQAERERGKQERAARRRERLAVAQGARRVLP